MTTSRELEEERKAITERIKQYGVDINPRDFGTRQLRAVETMLHQAVTFHRLNIPKGEENA